MCPSATAHHIPGIRNADVGFCKIKLEDGSLYEMLLCVRLRMQRASIGRDAGQARCTHRRLMCLLLLLLMKMVQRVARSGRDGGLMMCAASSHPVASAGRAVSGGPKPVVCDFIKHGDGSGGERVESVGQRRRCERPAGMVRVMRMMMGPVPCSSVHVHLGLLVMVSRWGEAIARLATAAAGHWRCGQGVAGGDGVVVAARGMGRRHGEVRWRRRGDRRSLGHGVSGEC